MAEIILKDIALDLQLTDIATHGDVDRLQHVISERRCYIAALGRSGTNLLMISSLERQFNFVHYLISHGYVSSEPEVWKSPTDTDLDYVLDYDIHLQVKRGVRFVRSSCEGKRWIPLPFDAAINLQHRDNNSATALHYAAEGGNARIVHALIDIGASVSDVNKYGQTALHLASVQCHLECARVLVASGADASVRANDGDMPLHSLITQAWPGIHHAQDYVSFLLTCPNVHPHHVNKRGEQPLHIAARRHHLAIAELLILAGADINARDSSGRTPLYLALGSEQFVDLLCRYEPKVIEREEPRMLLREATRVGNINVVQKLLSAGVAESGRGGGDDVQTALHIACQTLHGSDAALAMVTLLLDSGGANIGQVDHKGDTCLISAVKSMRRRDNNESSDRLIKELIRLGVNVNHVNNHGMTALHVAARHAHLTLIEVLVASGADVNLRCCKCFNYCTPLLLLCDEAVGMMYCSRMSHGGMDEYEDDLILYLGARGEDQRYYQRAHYSRAGESRRIIKCFLYLLEEAGSHVDIPNGFGITAQDVLLQTDKFMGNVHRHVKPNVIELINNINEALSKCPLPLPNIQPLKCLSARCVANCVTDLEPLAGLPQSILEDITLHRVPTAKCNHSRDGAMAITRDMVCGIFVRTTRADYT